MGSNPSSKEDDDDYDDDDDGDDGDDDDAGSDYPGDHGDLDGNGDHDGHNDIMIMMVILMFRRACIDCPTLPYFPPVAGRHPSHGTRRRTGRTSPVFGLLFRITLSAGF